MQPPVYKQSEECADRAEGLQPACPHVKQGFPVPRAQCLLKLRHVDQGNDNHGGEHPKVAAVRAASRDRLQKQESEESRSKEALVKNAATYLETFYQVRAVP